jgi:hypothetical protein
VPLGSVAGALLALTVATGALGATCPGAVPGAKRVFWGDLHVHTAYSLDAYGFGTLATPADAYRFARGAPLTLADGSTVRLDRPLDFTAVTDHAEWFDFLYLCTDPGKGDHPDCRNLRDNASPATGGILFGQYVVPSITRAEPQSLPLCREDPEGCRLARLAQWERIQAQAHAAYEPCAFTTFVAYEWSATRNFRHTHRNVIFASDRVPAEAFGYVQHPDLDDLFRLLDAHCDPRHGCDVLTIPHNTNMGDGTTFDVELETDRQLALRARFERLVEIFQEKGSSECLSPLGATDEADCAFERRLSRRSRPAAPEDFDSAAWEHMRRTYVRGLLLRGLAGHLRSGAATRNPLQLGIIASTDGHAATPGFVAEDAWHGPVFGLGDLDRAMSRLDWNPGGLVAVRAEENTRASLFAALKRREVYGTSGPRIELVFEADAEPLSCEDERSRASVPMGGELARGPAFFRVRASMDRTPLQRIELIKGFLEDGIFRETVVPLWDGDGEAPCAVWRDPDFAEDGPAFWYARVLERPTARWSAHRCREAGRCEAFPGADVRVRERAWASPIWYLPAPGTAQP